MTDKLVEELRETAALHGWHDDPPTNSTAALLLKAADSLSEAQARAEHAEAELAVVMQAITDPENQPSQYGTVLASTAERAEAELAALRERERWLSIESAPMDSFPRLYLCRGRVVQAFVDASGTLTVQHELGWRAMRRKPSHWRPLPAPPAGGEEG